MPFTPSPQLWAYLAGCTTVLFIWPLLRYMMGSTTKEEKKNDKIYNLHHSILNLELPPKTMWMNMGYWDHVRKHSPLPPFAQKIFFTQKNSLQPSNHHHPLSLKRIYI